MYATLISAHSSTAAPLIQPDHHPKPILGDARTKSGFTQAAAKDRPAGGDGLNHPSIFVVRRPNISTSIVELIGHAIQSQQSAATAKAQATFDELLARCFDQGTKSCPT